MADTASIPIIDVDSHVSEPPDLWSSRLPRKWREDGPIVRRNPRDGEEEWWVGDTKLQAVGSTAMAGWRDYMPSRPPTMEDMVPGAYRPDARLKVLDEQGIYAQVLYSNILGFYSPSILNLSSRDARLPMACVQAYNDFLTEFASVDPNRLLPVTWVPFWDVDAAVAEIERCCDSGHRGVVFGSELERIGFPQLADPHWDPIFSVCQERELSVNFHVGFGMFSLNQMKELVKDAESDVDFDRRDFAKKSALLLVGNMRAIAEVLMSGLAERFPRLNFVSIESGYGYIPYLLEALDWQWENGGVRQDHPNSPLPSEMFKRQVYATFWFEKSSVELLGQLPDNIMFETDFPHPTCLWPGPATIARSGRDTVAETLADVPNDLARKVLWENAARIYHVKSFDSTSHSGGPDE